MAISIRLEEHRDFKTVEYLTRETFWDLYRPGCCEHLVVHTIRKDPAFIPELSYVVCDGETVIGNIIYSKAKVVRDDQNEFEVLCMGPFAVLPAYQKKGIGARLLNHTLEQAKERGFKAVIIFGNPVYYQRFSFRNAKDFGITTAWGANLDAFMALELSDGSLNGITGKFFASQAFDIKDQELEEFEKQFPYREKHVTDTQLKL